MPPKAGLGDVLLEVAVGVVLGLVGGGILGASEGPVERSLSAMTAPEQMKPLVEEARGVGPLGLGSLMGAVALTVAMTSVVAGVVFSAAVASVFVVTRGCGASQTNTVALWVAAGLAGVYGTTVSGATLGLAVEWIVRRYGAVALLVALCGFTLAKMPFHFIFSAMFQSEGCLGGGAWSLGGRAWSQEREQLDRSASEQWRLAAAQLEQRIETLENGGEVAGPVERERWASEKRHREELERRRQEAEEAELQQRSLQDWVSTVLRKHIAFLAFSGGPMTLVALVASAVGVCGYGGHQAALPVLVALVGLVGFVLLRSERFEFWMLIGCMGMIAALVVALLTLHAEQLVVSAALKQHRAGGGEARSSVSERMDQQAALEALNAAFFVAKVCQLGLGATVGGPLVRRGGGGARVVVGAAALGAALLWGAELLEPVLGLGGTAGALLGAVGATGAALGAAAAMATQTSTWIGTFATFAGLGLGAVAVGEGHVVNIGLQLPVAYVFAMTNPF